MWRKNILIYNISHITLIDSEPLRIRFDEIDGFISIYDGTRYLTLLGSEKYDTIYDRIRYLTCLKSNITHNSSYYFVKIEVASYDSLPIEKLLTLHNSVMRIKSVLKKR